MEILLFAFGAGWNVDLRVWDMGLFVHGSGRGRTDGRMYGRVDGRVEVVGQ